MGMNWAMKPLTDKPSIYAKKLASRIDQPSSQSQRTFEPGGYLGQYEDFANKLQGQVKGGIAGGIEGVGNLMSDMTSPVGIASSLAGMPWLKNLMRGGSMANKAMNPTMDIIDSPAVRQMMPGMDDVGSLIGDMRRNLARVPSRGMGPQAPQGINPSMLPSDLIPRGGEGAFNAGRSIYGPAAKSLEDVAYNTVRTGNDPIRKSIGGSFNLAEAMRRSNAVRGR